MSKSISRSSLWGMVVVSGLSIVLLGGAWIGRMYYDFMDEASALREEHFAARKAMVREEVEKGVALINTVRTDMVKALWNSLRKRGSEAESLVEVLTRDAGAMSQKLVRENVAEIMLATQDEGRSLFAVSGDTIYLLSPFPVVGDEAVVIEKLAKAFRGYGQGEHQVAATGLAIDGRCTMMLVVRQLENPSVRIVSGACLEEAEKAIKQDVVQKLERVNFGEGGYLFGGNWDGISIIGPVKGRNMWGATDASGVMIVQELIAAAKRGGDFVSYVMPPLDGRRHTEKISYSMPVADWKWYVGAGQYVDDIESVIALKREKMEQEVFEQLLLILAGLVFIALVALSLSRRLAGKMRENVRFFLDEWEHASSEGGMVDPASLHYREFKRLARAANEMIEARKSADLEVRERIRQFRILAGNIPGIIFQSSVDGDWSMLYVSDAVESMTGYPPSDFVGNAVRSFDSIVEPNDRAWVRENITRAVAEQRPYSIEYRIEKKDGGILWVFENGQARYDARGEALVLDGAIFDITEKKQAEEEHYKHIHYLETIERIDREARRTGDMETVLSDTLEAIRLAFGADRCWLLRCEDPDSDTFSIPFERTSPMYPGARTEGGDVILDDETRAGMKLVFDSDMPVPFDSASGNTVPAPLAERFEVQSQLVKVIRPRTGNPWLLGLHQCASPRVWGEDEIRLFQQVGQRLSDALSSMLILEALKTSEERFRTFSEQSLLGLSLLQDDRVVFANQAFCDIFEMRVDEVLALPPRGFLELVHPDDREFLMDQARKKQAGDPDVVTRYNWRALTRTGRVRWVENHSKTVILDGRTADLVSLVDITESHRTREEVEAIIEERTASLSRKAREL